MSGRVPYGVLGAALLLVLAGTATAREPIPLRGSPLKGETGLRLLVSDSPPFVLDVDTGSVTPLRGLQAGAGVGFSVVPVAASAAVVVAWEKPFERKRMYIARSDRTMATPLGRARDVVPAANGSGVWVTRVVSRGRCVLQRIGLDGRRTKAREIPCDWIIAAGGSLGLLAGRSRIVDPHTARTVLGVAPGHPRGGGQAPAPHGPRTHRRTERHARTPGLRERLRTHAAGAEPDRLVQSVSGRRSKRPLHRSRARQPVVAAHGSAGPRRLGARHGDRRS